MGIAAIDLPERAAMSRKYSEQDGAAALDLLAQGQTVSDEAQYEKEDQARSSGNSLKRAIRGAAQRRGVEPPELTVRVRQAAPGAFVYGVTVKPPTADTGDGGTAENLEDLSRPELNDRAEDAGVDNPEGLPNRKAVMDAIRQQQAPAAA